MSNEIRTGSHTFVNDRTGDRTWVNKGQVFHPDQSRVEDVHLSRSGKSEVIEHRDGVREVIDLRLAPLDEACVRLLIVGAVIGGEFELEPLERISDLQGEDLAASLDEALGAGLVLAGLPTELPPPLTPEIPLGLVCVLAIAARNTVASLVASAFFRYTTWMLAASPPAEGVSSRSTSEQASRASPSSCARRAAWKSASSRRIDVG